MECCIHSEKGSDPNDKIIQASAKSGDTILYYAQEWIKTRDEYGRSHHMLLLHLNWLMNLWGMTKYFLHHVVTTESVTSLLQIRKI